MGRNDMTAKGGTRNGDELPPWSAEAECGVLGCVLLEPRLALGTCVEKLKGGAASFYDLRHQVIYSAMLALYERKMSVDLITLVDELKRLSRLEEVGGAFYLAYLPDQVPSAANLDYYIEIVVEKFVLRKILRTCSEVKGQVLEEGVASAVVLDAVERTFMEIGQARSGNEAVGGRVFVQMAIDRLENYSRGHAQMLGMSTGFDYLDKMTCGFQGGQLIVLAARPGLGKTSLLMCMMEHVAIGKGLGAGIFSLEMTADELGARLMFQVARADYQRFRTGYLENADIANLTVAAKKIQLAPMWIDDSSGLNVLQLRSKARRMVLEHGVKVIGVDYLQLMKATRTMGNREQEVAEISTGLKSLAKELKVPVIVLAQFNRDIEKDPNRKPRLSDLRESGQIEADADVVGMLYEPKLKEEELQALDQVDPDWAKKWKRVNCLIAKQRNGPTGDVQLEFHKSSMRFESYIKRARTG
jgi:replicative DNA helicase